VAIYHLSVSAVSRSTGRSAVAAAAYRAGDCLRDERTGQVHDYRRRSGVLMAEIVAPPGSVPFDRERLWQAAEAAEKRKDARTAREIRIALPAELDADACRDLARRFGLWLAERYRTVVDVAVHAPDRTGDQRNVHAHILMPTREIGADGTFGAKLRVLHDPKTGPAEIEAMRVAWEELANRALAAAGVDARIDHRSLAEQGLDRAPTVHLGPAATAVERRTGEPSQIRERAEEAARRAEEARAAILDEQRAAAERVARLRERLREARQAWAAEQEARRPSAVVRRAWSWVQQAAETSAKAAAKATVEAAAVVAGAAAILTRRVAAMVQTAGQAWRARMRQRQAAITRAKQGAARRAARPVERVDEEARYQARHVDLVRWCEGQGLTVERDGRDHWRVRGPGGAGVCRITQRPGERPVWVSWDGIQGGDAIAFVQWWQPGTSYREAVEALTGPLPPPLPARSSAPAPERPTRPVLPPEADREAGRQYLASRGLDDATLDAAERAGVLRYTRGAVLLVGRDERGEPRHVLRRGYLSDDPAPKRALAGSDTSYPVVLRGDPSRVVIVEGPVTGLAACSLARMRGDPPPTVIVTGGVATRRWVRVATDVLRAARTVEIAAEREADPQRQAATDAARQRLAAAIEDVTGRVPKLTWPAPGCGDLADELAARRAEERRRLEEEERRRRDEEERRRRREEEFLWQIEQEARQRAEAAAARKAEEERRAPEMRQAEEAARRRQAEARARHTPEMRRVEEERSSAEARRAAILEEEMRKGAAQLAQARTSWEREAVETAARMRAHDRWRAEGIMPKEPRPGRNRRRDEEWEPPQPRF